MADPPKSGFVRWELCETTPSPPALPVREPSVARPEVDAQLVRELVEAVEHERDVRMLFPISRSKADVIAAVADVKAALSKVKAALEGET